MPEPILPNAQRPLDARNRAAQVRAIALEMIVTADELAAARSAMLRAQPTLEDALAEVQVLGERCGLLENENARLRHDMALLMAVPSHLRGQTGDVPSPEALQGETPDQDTEAAQPHLSGSATVENLGRGTEW